MSFMKDGCNYVVGAVSHLDCVDIDMMSIVELDSIVKQSGIPCRCSLLPEVP